MGMVFVNSFVLKEKEAGGGENHGVLEDRRIMFW